MLLPAGVAAVVRAAAAGGIGVNRVQAAIDAGADFSDKPPVTPRHRQKNSPSRNSPPATNWNWSSRNRTFKSRWRWRSTATAGCTSSRCGPYMQDADATGELQPGSIISRHEDKDNDGVYETHTVFVDKLIIPRFVLPLDGNAIVTMDSNVDEAYKYTDTDGDGVADKKELFATGLGRRGNIEHQQSSLFWALDNWMYSTVNPFRIRWTPQRRSLAGRHGQQRRPMGRKSGQLRQGLHPGRRLRRSELLSTAHPLWPV